MLCRFDLYDGFNLIKTTVCKKLNRDSRRICRKVYPIQEDAISKNYDLRQKRVRCLLSGELLILVCSLNNGSYVFNGL